MALEKMQTDSRFAGFGFADGGFADGGFADIKPPETERRHRRSLAGPETDRHGHCLACLATGIGVGAATGGDCREAVPTSIRRKAIGVS